MKQTGKIAGAAPHKGPPNAGDTLTVQVQFDGASKGVVLTIAGYWGLTPEQFVKRAIESEMQRHLDDLKNGVSATGFFSAT